MCGPDSSSSAPRRLLFTQKRRRLSIFSSVNLGSARSSCAGDDVLAIAGFSYGAASRFSCGVSRKVRSGRDAAATDAKERAGFTSTRDACTIQSSARGVPRAHKLFLAFTSHELPITDLRSQGRGGGEGCPLGVT